MDLMKNRFFCYLYTFKPTITHEFKHLHVPNSPKRQLQLAKTQYYIHTLRCNSLHTDHCLSMQSHKPNPQYLFLLRTDILTRRKAQNQILRPLSTKKCFRKNRKHQKKNNTQPVSLFGPFHRIKYLTFFIDHVQVQLFLIGSNQRKTGFTAAELGSFHRIYLTAQRT